MVKEELQIEKAEPHWLRVTKATQQLVCPNIVIPPGQLLFEYNLAEGELNEVDQSVFAPDLKMKLLDQNENIVQEYKKAERKHSCIYFPAVSPAHALGYILSISRSFPLMVQIFPPLKDDPTDEDIAAAAKSFMENTLPNKTYFIWTTKQHNPPLNGFYKLSIFIHIL